MEKLKRSTLPWVCFFILFAYSCHFASTVDPEDTLQQIHIMVVDPGFSTYIEEYSSGIVPVDVPFKVQVTPAVAYAFEKKKGSIDLSGLFSISPSIKGECTYKDEVFIFKPEENLKEGTEYVLTFHLKDILDVPVKFEDLKFNTFTLQRNFSVLVEGLKALDSDQDTKYSLEGGIVTSVPLKDKEIEQVIKAEQEGDDLKIKWDHSLGNNRHHFSVQEIRRKGKASSVDLSWNGKSIHAREKGEKKIEIPASSEYKLISTTVIDQPEQKVKLLFSDPLNRKQDIEGLVGIVGAKSYELSAEGNQITIYLKERLKGLHRLVMDRSIKNYKGESLPEALEVHVDFELLKPDLRLPGRGVIMPDTGSVIFPFEAVNVKAVDLRIVKIFPSNIARFLQNSSLDDAQIGSYSLRRVGKLVYSKRVDLVTRDFVDLNKWNAFSIDLSRHITIEKGAIYQVKIGMQKAYSLYACNDTTVKETDKTYDSNRAVENEKDFWENDANEENKYSDRYYNWKLRENPC